MTFPQEEGEGEGTMFKLMKSLDRKGVSPVVATVLLIALTVAAGAVIWVVVNNYLSNTTGTATVTASWTNGIIQRDSDNHNNIIQLDFTLTVDGADAVIIENIYLKNTANNWYFRAASRNLGGQQYWQGNLATSTFSSQSESTRTIQGSRTYNDLDFAYTGASATNNFVHTSLNLDGNTIYTWEVWVEWRLPGESGSTLIKAGTLSTPFA